MELWVFNDFTRVAEQVMVKELLFHFALQEGLNCLFEVRWISLEYKEVELVAVVVWEVPVFLIGTQSVPLFDELKNAELSTVSSFYFSYLVEDVSNLG